MLVHNLETTRSIGDEKARANEPFEQDVIDKLDAQVSALNDKRDTLNRVLRPSAFATAAR